VAAKTRRRPAITVLELSRGRLVFARQYCFFRPAVMHLLQMQKSEPERTDDACGFCGMAGKSDRR
jgi:phosphoenolpyruvate-protein kinase (PTS system EI component)